MEKLLFREMWEPREGESQKDYLYRERQQNKEFDKLVKEKGLCFVVRYGDEDYRPMWECDINVDILRSEILSPDSTPFDCPLCQPYDPWYGPQHVQQNRRFMCRIIQPNWYVGCIEEDGIHAKCICIKRGRVHKFQKTAKQGVNSNGKSNT